ncbi:MAG TPA: Calx-beta domain-containing protein [Acidimicrobiia bacterium]|nr:Calx-beta domain-containing protein [Acidimicrobiia bacterium]
MRIGGTRRRVAWATAVAVIVSMASAAGWTRGEPALARARDQQVAATTTPSRPNILLIVSDDQTWSTFNPSLMPNVYSQIADQGVLFDNAYVNTSLCCPSRSQMLTGLFATDTGVSANTDQLERPTLVQAMHDSGYRTMLAGKYLNSYPCQDVRPEFDDWYCYGGGNSGEKDPTIDVNGTDLPFTGYSPDILAGFVSHFIQTTPSDQPFFAVYTPKDPHAPANDDRFDNIDVPTYRPPNFDEDTVADGKPLVDQRGPFTNRDISTIDTNYQDMYRSSRGVDDAVGTMLASLGPRADNTEVIYISDNGFFYGEHRKVQGKIAPYQESVNVPLAIRDPQLRATSDPLESKAVVQNIDLPATIAARAGVPWHAEGESLSPILDGSQSTVRDAALIEHCIAAAGRACWPPNSPAKQVFLGVVTDRYKYIEYASGDRALYDLDDDPYELHSVAGDPDYADVQSQLVATLAALRAGPPPDTTIVTGPSGIVAPGVRTFTYFTQAIASTYTCRLSSVGDPGAWAPCGAQQTTIGPLDPGTYTFAVEGTTNGVTDPTPAERTFTVDGTRPVVSVGDTAGPEHGSLSFTVSLDRPSNKRVSVEYRTDDLTAQSGSDYTTRSGTVAFAAHQTSKVVTVPVHTDRFHEADETLRFDLRNPVNGVLGATDATGTIFDDDAAPKVSVARASAVEGTEPGGTLRFPIKLSAISGLPVTVQADTVIGTAHQQDFKAVHTTVTIGAGERTASVSVPITGDALSENDEHFKLQLSDPVGAALGTASAQGTIVDDDPSPSISIGDTSVIEGDEGDQTTVSFPVTLSARAGRPITVHYATADGSASAPDDYTATSGTLTFPIGVTSETVHVPVVGDDLTEGDEQFTVGLSNPLHATLADVTGTATIFDDDSPPVVSIADPSVLEGDTGSVNAHFVVSLTVPSRQTVTVAYTTADGSATAPDDYTAGSGTITFTPGQTEASVDVPVVGDTLVESDETFTVILSDPIHASLGTASATGTILDDDSRPTVSVGDSPRVSEGDSGTTDAVFPVSLDAPSNRDVSVDYATSDGTATAPEDYLATSGTLTIRAGETNGTISVPVVGDTRYEQLEHFTLTISNPVAALLGDDTADAAILDDDPTPTITLQKNVVVTEGDSGTTDAVFTAQLSAPSGLTTTVDFDTSDVTATAPADYTATSGTVTIAPGDTTGTFSVPVVGDTLYEGEERFLVTLSNGTNGDVSDDDFGGYGIIEDDDAEPVISVADPRVDEGDAGTTNATFTVSIDAPSGLDTSVAYTTVDGSATAPDDYDTTTGVLTIPAGETSATVDVAVNGDTEFEGDETFSLAISDPLNAQLGFGSADATIVDDDPAPEPGLHVF